MNRQEYLNALEKALKAARVQDCADILEEYAAHFDMKAQDGYSEEEIAAKLASPRDIAEQFTAIRPAGSSGRAGGAIIKIGLICADIFAALFFILLYAWVVTLGAVALASLGLGVSMAIGASMWNIIPGMPYINALIIGISLLALAALAVIGTEYCRLYVAQILKVYVRWHGNSWGKANASPPLPLHPVINPKKRRIMRSAALIALVVFAVTLIAGLASMMIAAGSLEPWHAWHWFE